MAVDVLKSRGVPENRILFLNLLASPQGIENFAKKFPELRIITAFVDQVRSLFQLLHWQTLTSLTGFG
jgi:uracil phosphoribosyltransferase